VESVPSVREILKQVLEVQSVLLMALASIHLAKAQSSRIARPQVIVPGGPLR